MALVALRQEPGISDRRIALLDKIIRNARPGSGRTVEGYKNLPITVVRRRRDREIITNAPKKYHTEVMYTGEVMSNYNEKAYLDNKAARGILGNIEWGVNYYEPSRWQEGWTYPDEDIAMSSGQLVIRPSELSNDRLMHPRFARLAFCITFPWMNSFTYVSGIQANLLRHLACLQIEPLKSILIFFLKKGAPQKTESPKTRSKTTPPF